MTARNGRASTWPKERERLISAGRCPCDPTRGDSCRNCDGTAADEREQWRAAR